MERESGSRTALGNREHTRRMIGMSLWMIWPWAIMFVGLHVLGEFRLTIMFYQIFGCALPVFLNRSWVPIFPIRISWWRMSLSILLSVILFLGVFKFNYHWLVDLKTTYHNFLAIRMSPNKVYWGYAAFLVFFNPIFEEAFWRGFIYRGWKELIGWEAALLVSSAFFGAWHWTILSFFCNPLGAVLLTTAVIFGGIVFGYAYEKTGTLGAPILLHGLGADLPAVFAVYTLMIQSATFPG